jgi:hypothetical protein
MAGMIEIEWKDFSSIRQKKQNLLQTGGKIFGKLDAQLTKRPSLKYKEQQRLKCMRARFTLEEKHDQQHMEARTRLSARPVRR